jgi:hypothetical protein
VQENYRRCCGIDVHKESVMVCVYKTDPKDARWIADLLEGGKLRGSWVPPRPIRELRDLDAPQGAFAGRFESGQEPD